uniref:RICTOR_N domain-containing protein n=1 Tax=Angiostrongylus cantonensis TaxID=6313 RepID=A0A0K0D2V0_ANGCA
MGLSLVLRMVEFCWQAWTKDKTLTGVHSQRTKAKRLHYLRLLRSVALYRLLEINNCSGEQFKSALMLTKLISDANGARIRFVVLKTIDRLEDGSVSFKKLLLPSCSFHFLPKM